MTYIAIGALGFLVIHSFDIVSLKRIPRAKPFIWILGSGLLVYALTMACLRSYRLPLPIWATWLGWALVLISLLLLIYCLFINLPFRKTYITAGVCDKLVTTRLYALVRHPWIHCFTLFLLFLVLASRSSLLLIASQIWISLCILLVVIRDKFLFGRMFKGYDIYRQETPMLLPNRRSVNAFVSSLRQGRA